jgi:ElaB/YqjD/DUF883 family membrane-anchored ribosome-binding protein
MQAESLRAPDANGSSASAPITEPESAEGAISGVAREFQNFVADMEDLIQSTTSLNGEDLARAKAKLQARIAAAKESVQRIGAPFIDRARNTVRATDGYVHEQPWQAIAIAAGASALVGYLLGRRG